MMDSQAVLEVVGALERAGVRVWLDGGWGVDALLGEQTRPHDDLDVVIALDDAPATQAALAGRGFGVSEEELPTRFVLRDRHDRRIDFHTVAFDAEGGGVQRLQDGSPWHYPPESFFGEGRVAGVAVPCLTAEVQVLAHLGYEPDATDRHDMRLLVERFGLKLPERYGA